MKSISEANSFGYGFVSRVSICVKLTLALDLPMLNLFSLL